ncbi:Selenocysteine Se-methyltransferase [Capsicum chinense]|nr:Selenocysteine Se-methyltransferase [Capsicum chinense]
MGTSDVNAKSSSSSLVKDFLRKCGGVAVIDGGFATELERHGADLNDPLWSAKCLFTDPHLVRAATIQGFKAKGYSVEESESLLKRSVEIACEARDVYYNRCRESSSDHSTDGKILKQRPILVAASVGSYGAYLADGSEYRNLTPCLDGGFLWYGMVNKGTMFVLIVF